MARRAIVVLLLTMGAAACSSGGGSTGAASSVPAQPTTSSALPTSTSAAASCAPATTAPGGNGAKEVNDPGDIPDNQAFVPYTPPSGELTVKVPEGWARSDAADAVTFTDKFNSIRIEVRPSSQPPTVQSVTAGELPSLRSSSRCFEAGEVKAIARKGGDAVLVTYRVDGTPDPVTGKVVREAVERYEFGGNGRTAVLTLSGAVGADNVDPWRIVSDSFTWR